MHLGHMHDYVEGLWTEFTSATFTNYVEDFGFWQTRSSLIRKSGLGEDQIGRFARSYGMSKIFPAAVDYVTEEAVFTVGTSGFVPLLEKLRYLKHSSKIKDAEKAVGLLDDVGKVVGTSLDFTMNYAYDVHNRRIVKQQIESPNQSIRSGLTSISLTPKSSSRSTSRRSDNLHSGVNRGQECGR